MTYYIKSNGKIYGPLEEGKIKEKVISGFFSENSSLSTDLKGWVPLQQCMDVPHSILSQEPDSAQNTSASCTKTRMTLSVEDVVHPGGIPPQRKPFLQNRIYLIAGVSLAALMLCTSIFFFAISGSSDDTERVIIRKKRSVAHSTSKMEDETSETEGKKSSESDVSGEPKSFVEVCDKYKTAVGLVVVRLEDSDGKLLSTIAGCKIPSDYPIGTAFAVDKNKFVTNCHVAYGLQGHQQSVLDDICIWIASEAAKKEGVKTYAEFEEYCQKHAKDINDIRKRLQANVHVRVRDVEIRLSDTGGKSLRVTGVQIHPRFRAEPTTKEERDKNSEFDISMLTTAETTDIFFKLAPKDKLYELNRGQEIASLGFPMEGLSDNGQIDLNSPEAVLNEGTIKRVTSYNRVSSTNEMNKTIIHNLPAAGGASGSPIFLPTGEIVAILWGVSNHGTDANGARITSAAMQNFATRIDSLDDVRDQPIRSIEKWTGEK